MTKLSKTDKKESTERFERFVALTGGQYWQAKVSDESRYIEQGEILMISKVDYVDNAPHTIHVRLHPSKVDRHPTTVRFLSQEFVANFEFVEQSDAEASRKAEIEAIQGRIQDEQAEMQRAYSDPKLLDELVDAEIPRETAKGEAKLPAKLETFGADIVGAVKTQNITALMSKGLTENGIEQIRSGLEGQKDVAVRRSKWIQMRTMRLTQMSGEITPYLEEKAAFPLAMTQEMMDHVDDLMKGIGNLNLYVLKNVEIVTVQKGKSAPSKEKLSVTQRVLYMDEEMGVWAELSDEFDYRDDENFLTALKSSKELVNQIFPAERCVVSVAATRKHHEYDGYSNTEKGRMHMENQRQYLMIRDGENIYKVLSPELFHNFARTTFPTTSETESVFKGMDGSTISYRDLDYTRKLKEHDRIALGYKRLLILLCGLDHNKKLFGDFYEGEQSLEFVSLSFQQKYFNFIHDVDGDGMLPSYRPANVCDWAIKMNSEISYGSRVLVKWRNVFNEDTCPAAFEKDSMYNRGHNRGRSMQYYPTQGQILYGVISKRGDDMIMKVEVSGNRTSDFKKRTFEATLNVSLALQYAETFDILCVDRLNPKDAKWYLHDRPSRNIHFDNILMLKRALGYAEELRKEEAGVRDKLNDAITKSGLFNDCEQLERIMDHAIAKWRCANPRKQISKALECTKEFNLLCDQIYVLAGKGRNPETEIRKSESDRGRTVLRIALKPNGKYVAYSTPLDEERDDRACKFTWVAKTPYDLLKKGARSSKTSFVHLGKVNNAETVIYESKNIESYVLTGPTPFDTVKKKANFLKSIEQSNAQLKEIMRIKSENDDAAASALIEEYHALRDQLTYGRNSRGVSEPYIDLALGASATSDSPLFIGIKAPVFNVLVWLVAGNKALESQLHIAYLDAYANKASASDRLVCLLRAYKGKSLFKSMGVQVGDQVHAGMHKALSEYNYTISERDGFNYSLAKRIEKFVDDKRRAIWLVGSTVASLDQDYDITRPDDYEPLIVVSEGFVTDRNLIHIFQFSDKNMMALRGKDKKVVDNFKEVESTYRHKHYFSSDDKTRHKVDLEWRNIPRGEINGIQAEQSFEYTEVSREKLDD